MIVPHLDSVKKNESERCEWFENCLIVEAIHDGNHYYTGWDVRVLFNTEYHDLAMSAIVTNDIIHHLLYTAKK